MAEKNVKAIEELRRKPKNKECMDCHEKVDFSKLYAVSEPQ